jgi:hypothetical protein
MRLSRRDFACCGDFLQGAGGRTINKKLLHNTKTLADLCVGTECLDLVQRDHGDAFLQFPVV